MSLFSKSGSLRVRKSTFPLFKRNNFTCEMGKLVPCFFEEVLPGDKFVGRSDALIRLAPQLAPVMSNVNAYVHYYFVPNRLLWDNGNDKNDSWETFITAGQDGNQTPTKPYMESTGFPAGSLGDYLGFPDKIASGVFVDAMPFRAYNLIFNEWYRDENLQDELPISLNGGKDTTTSTTLQNRCWEKDYFTSALPFAQRGTPVSIPLSGDAPVIGDGNSTGFDYYQNSHLVTGYSYFKTNLQLSSNSVPITGGGDIGTLAAPSSARASISQDPEKSHLIADLSEVSAVNINDLRDASAIQRWMEKSARFGYRYVEQLLSFFGVKSPDARLQRPEYIGGGKSPVIFSEVLQTSASDTTSPQGNMAGHAFSSFTSNKFKYFAKEHGWIVGILSVMPDTMYQQGIPRKFSRQSRYDYFFPEFQNLGEQAVLNKEIYANSAEPDGIFGFQQRYQEYRTFINEIHGDFKTSLAFWHLGRIFDNEPKLNASFVQCNPSTRIFPVQTEGNNNLWISMEHLGRVTRPMVKYSVPQLK